ncbi:trypsin iota-like [Dermacentor albipictus]|uniref:trypsin iota-like n=1 Tax=Dermacentor albipictus TaxID=60249 RepID=UPI0038FCED12
MNFQSCTVLVLVSGFLIAVTCVKTKQYSRMNMTLNEAGCGEAMASRFVDDVAMENAVVAQNPWVVLLVIRIRESMGTCSGTIVTPMHVVTNAQCLVRERAGPRSVTVFYASSEKFHGYRVRGSSYFIHPAFSEATLNHDIALLRVDSPFIQSMYARPVCIPVERFDTDGLFVIVTGWGQEDNTTRPQHTMYTTVVRVSPAAECRNLYKRFGFDEHVMLCAKRADKNYCESDTGGSAVAAAVSGHFYLVGLLSYSTSCASLGGRVYPSIFTRVDVFASWIGRSLNSFENYKALRE